MNDNLPKKGFTLLELLIVVAIIAILAGIIFLVINPSEILKKSRDSQRISDLATLKKSINIYKINKFDPKIAGIDNYGCKGTIADTAWQPTNYIYYSYPNDGVGAPITSKTLDGFTFTTGGAHQVSTISLASIDGTGWLPINFASISGGSPISKLPVDPVNKITDLANPNSTDLVYRFVCSEKTLRYEIDATLESKYYTIDNNLMSKDGGNNDSYYEVGTDLSLFYNENLVSSCVANCTNKVCGDDGCGGSCGNCINNETCSNGICQAPVFVCGQAFIDSRDSNSYSTVDINGQCWLSQNLAYLPIVSSSTAGSTSTPYYYVYGYQGEDVNSAKINSNYSTYGVLYNNPASLIACPSNWHLPSNTELINLITYAGGSSVAGESLKASPLNIVPWDGTNSLNFTALSVGRRHNVGSFFSQGVSAWFWSSTLNGSGAWTIGVNSVATSASRSVNSLDFGYSVRCIKD